MRTRLRLSVLSVTGWLATAAATPSPPASCTAIEADLTHEAELAQLYLDIAEEEEAAGRFEPAKLAYREALRREPALVAAERGLQALCHRSEPDDDEDDALLALLEAGRCGDAVARIDATSPEARPAEASTQLLEGICRYELGDDTRADTVLAQAEREEKLRDVAQLYRGLIASRNGRSKEARAWFESAGARSTDARLRRTAQALAYDTGRGETLSALFMVDGGNDSNVALLPNGSPLAEATPDGFAGTSMLLSAYPWGARGPGLQVMGQLRKQLSTRDFDVSQGGLWLFWQPVLGDWEPRIQLFEQFYGLGFEPYLFTHELGAAIRRREGASWLELSYALALDDYRQAELEPYAGPRHSGALSGLVPLGQRATFRVSYSLERLRAADATLSYVEHGALSRLRVSLLESVTVSGGVSASWRRHANAAGDAGLLRRQRFFDLSLELEWAFEPRWTLLGSVSRRLVTANPEEFGYERWVSSLGVSYALALF